MQWIHSGIASEVATIKDGSLLLFLRVARISDDESNINSLQKMWEMQKKYKEGIRKSLISLPPTDTANDILETNGFIPSSYWMILKIITKFASHELFLLYTLRTKFYPFLFSIAGLLIIDFIFLFNGKTIKILEGSRHEFQSQPCHLQAVTLGKAFLWVLDL